MVLNIYLFCFHAVPPEITVVEPEPVFSNEPVELVCTVVGGDPPRSITWTASNGTQVYSTNQTAGANVSLSITSYDYGEYMCIASNEFGRTSRSVQVRHPGLYSLKINAYTVSVVDLEWFQWFPLKPPLYQTVW